MMVPRIDKTGVPWCNPEVCPSYSNHRGRCTDTRQDHDAIVDEEHVCVPSVRQLVEANNYLNEQLTALNEKKD